MLEPKTLPYGAAESSGVLFTPGKRRRINALAIAANIFLPWLLFTCIFSVMSFNLHYRRPGVAWMIVLVAFVMVAVMGFVSYRSRARGGDPMWYTFTTMALLVAVVVATVCGDLNFWYNMQPYFDLQNLNTYPSVDPSRDKGQQVMDGGRVYFSDGAVLDMRKSMGFMNVDQYCVAPIVRGHAQLATYDFWAVGVNCCSGVTSDFRCGEYNNPYARSGLRLMRDDERPFYRLAVQQAEAAYNIKATHPLFFYWMQDPDEAMKAYRDAGFKYYIFGMLTHFAFNLFCVITAVVGFSKIGRY